LILLGGQTPRILTDVLQVATRIHTRGGQVVDQRSARSDSADTSGSSGGDGAVDQVCTQLQAILTGDHSGFTQPLGSVDDGHASADNGVSSSTSDVFASVDNGGTSIDGELASRDGTVNQYTTSSQSHTLGPVNRRFAAVLTQVEHQVCSVRNSVTDSRGAIANGVGSGVGAVRNAVGSGAHAATDVVGASDEGMASLEVGSGLQVGARAAQGIVFTGDSPVCFKLTHGVGVVGPSFGGQMVTVGFGFLSAGPQVGTNDFGRGDQASASAHQGSGGVQSQIFTSVSQIVARFYSATHQVGGYHDARAYGVCTHSQSGFADAFSGVNAETGGIAQTVG
jgi:hypothetical protein